MLLPENDIHWHDYESTYLLFLTVSEQQLTLIGGLEVDKSVLGWLGAEDGFSMFSVAPCADAGAGVDVVSDPAAVVPGWTETRSGH